MDEGMVPVSWLLSRDLQQWEYEDKTMQREEDTNGVRFTTINHHQARQAAGEKERPHLQDSQAREVPQAGGDGAV